MAARRQLSVLLFIFAAPVLSAWLLYLNPNWLPAQRINQGQLIEPVEPLSGLLKRIESSPAAESALRGRWILLSLAENCDAGCGQRLWRMRQVQRALGNDRRRVARLLTFSSPPAAAQLTAVVRAYPEMVVSTPDAHHFDDWKNRLRRAGQPLVGSIYLLDPDANLMMRYPPDATGQAILADLKRLLRYTPDRGTYARN